MLYPAKLRLFAVFSIIMHITFVILFAKVDLSFTPPKDHELSLFLLMRGKGGGDIVQSEAAWPTPSRIVPSFSETEIARGFDEEIKTWARLGVPELSFFAPKSMITPHADTVHVVDEAHLLPEQSFLHLPAELKPMPRIDFTLPQTMPEIFKDH